MGVDISGANMAGIDASGEAVSTFNDDGLGIDVPDSAFNSEEGRGGGDTSGVATAGVDAPVDELLGMDVVGEIAGENCTGVDVFVFEGEEQGGSEIPGGMGVAEEHPSSQ